MEVFEEYRAGLKDLDGFSHVILLYHFHRSEGFKLAVVPFMDIQPRVFSRRAPRGGRTLSGCRWCNSTASRTGCCI